MITLSRLLVASLAFTVIPSLARAQTSPEGALLATAVGRVVQVTTTDGQSTTGRLEDTSGGVLRLRGTTDRSVADGIRTVPLNTTVHVSERDALVDGAVKGALIGVGAMYGLLFWGCAGEPPLQCMADNHHDAWKYGGTFVVAPAVGLGALIDWRHRRTLFKAPPRGDSGALAVTPIIGRRTGGVALSMAF